MIIPTRDRARHIIAIKRAMPHINDETLASMGDVELAGVAAGCIGVAPGRQGNSHPDRRRRYQIYKVAPHGSTVSAPRNSKCPCGSGKKTEKCHPVPT